MDMAKRTDHARKRIAASPDRIYRALSYQDELVAWLPPNGMSAKLANFDFRPGGGYRMTLKYDAPPPAGAGKSSADEDIVDVRLSIVEPNRRVVQVIKFLSEDPAFADPMTMTWTLTPAGAATEVTIVASNVPDAIGEADHQAGLNASLDNLARHVAGA
jgi:uncharacterized protein YndB with AHSA1/START domain